MNQTTRMISVRTILIVALALGVFIAVKGIQCGATDLWIITGSIGVLAGVGMAAVWCAD